MRIMGTSFFLGIMATIILGITLLSIAIYDIACHRIRHVIKYLFFILMGILLIIFSLLFTVTGGTNLLLVLREIDIDYDKEIHLLLRSSHVGHFLLLYGIMVMYYCRSIRI